jgi:Flp pilus assembly pilin Flp
MLIKSLRKLAKDERGGEVLEYALILGLIIVATVAVITTIGSKVAAKYDSGDSAL